MEYLKTRRQLPPSTTRSVNASSSLQLLRQTVIDHGLQGLYSGCSALVLSNALKGGVRFIAFSQSHAFLLQHTAFGSANPGLSSVLAGLAAGAAESVLVVTPGEALKTRIIHQRAMLGDMQRQGLVRTVGGVVRAEGVRGLWSGLGPVLCKQGTNSAVRFATFGWFQERIRRARPDLGIGATLCAGAASGVVTT